MSQHETNQLENLEQFPPTPNGVLPAGSSEAVTSSVMGADATDHADAETGREPASENNDPGGQGQDTLAGLVERTVDDPGAPFRPEIVATLAALKKTDQAAFEALRAQLRTAGCRVGVLDKAIDHETGVAGQHTFEGAGVHLELAQSVELFRSPDGTGYADLEVNGHRETWPVKSRVFRRWMERQCYELEQEVPSAIALQSAIGLVEARAQYDAPERETHVRVASLEGRLYLDLCDEAWRAVEIDAAGWRVVDRPPVRFRRAAGMQPLSEPTAGGNLGSLRSFLNVRSDADFVLVVAWALTVLRSYSSYPLLVLSGEQGSAKSTFSQVLRSLIDPNTAPLRALPQQERDLFIAANNGHLLAFDNVSDLPPWLSDTFCRLASGTGYASRQLYSDTDEVLFKAARPILLNGIEEIVTKPDLADRALFLVLEPIAEECRRAEAELWAKFETERAQILGTLLDGISRGLRELPNIRLEKLPRMADFALWAAACETAYWPAGTFSAAYRGNRDDVVESIIEADLVAGAILAMMTGRDTWTGTASELLGVLARHASERVARSRNWPQSPRGMAGRVRRAATFLRKVGIDVSFSREGPTRKRTIHVVAVRGLPTENGGARSSAPAGPSASIVTTTITKEIAAPAAIQAAKGADGVADGYRPRSLLVARANALKNGTSAVMDGTNANSSYMSVLAKPVLLPWKGRL
jgi:hypothetical protein